MLFCRIKQRCQESPEEQSLHSPVLETSLRQSANQNTEHNAKAISLVDNPYYESSDADHVTGAKNGGVHYENVTQMVYTNIGDGEDTEAIVSTERKNNIYGNLKDCSHKDKEDCTIHEKQEDSQCTHTEPAYSTPYHNEENCVLCHPPEIVQ